MVRVPCTRGRCGYPVVRAPCSKVLHGALQVRLPFVAFGPMARGMPKRVSGHPCPNPAPNLTLTLPLPLPEREPEPYQEPEPYPYPSP